MGTTPQRLSGLASGVGALVITATTSGAAQTVHTATAVAGEFDTPAILASNKGTAAVDLKILYGAVEESLSIPPGQKIPIIEDAVLDDGIVLKMYCATASVIVITGKNLRYTP